MILRALYDYYQKHKDELPKPGLSQQEIKFMIVLEDDGSFAFLENLCMDAKGKTGQFYDLPRQKPRSGKKAWQTAQLLWDHCGFVLGFDEQKKDNALRQKEQFVKQLDELPDDLKKDLGIHAVLEFYRRAEEKKVLADPQWEQYLKNKGNLFSN